MPFGYKPPPKQRPQRGEQGKAIGDMITFLIPTIVITVIVILIVKKVKK